AVELRAGEFVAGSGCALRGSVLARRVVALTDTDCRRYRVDRVVLGGHRAGVVLHGPVAPGVEITDIGLDDPEAGVGLLAVEADAHIVGETGRPRQHSRPGDLA